MNQVERGQCLKNKRRHRRENVEKRRDGMYLGLDLVSQGKTFVKGFVVSMYLYTSHPYITSRTL